jgi:hypothetical protein
MNRFRFAVLSALFCVGIMFSAGRVVVTGSTTVFPIIQATRKISWITIPRLR